MKMISDQIKSGKERAPHRSLLFATGMKRGDVKKPFIGITIWIPMLGSAGYHDIPQGVLVTLIAAFVIWKHRSNIGRLLAGNENKIYLFKKGEQK